MKRDETTTRGEVVEADIFAEFCDPPTRSPRTEELLLSFPATVEPHVAKVLAGLLQREEECRSCQDPDREVS